MPADVSVSILEVLARGAAVGAFVGLALVIARPPFTPARIMGGLFCLIAAAHTLTQHPAVREALGPALVPVWALSVMGAGFFWAFATELFGDRARLSWQRFAPAAVLLAVGLGLPTTTGAVNSAFRLAHNLLSAGLMMHVLIVVWSGWRNDLVESRRRLRGPILGAGAVYAVSVLTVQTSEVFFGRADQLSPLAAGVLALIALASVATLLTADPELFAAPATAARLPTAVPSTPPNDEDGKLAERLDRLMRVERVYREEGLSIASLAGKVGVPEHRLRRLINQHLGHRNFAAYLNQWRLADAKQALADPSQREVTVSTIALDAGFQSLGPFNRAFKAEVGLTPSEFRTQTLASATAAQNGSPATAH